jgi:DNA replication and repair protein RecF
MTLASLSVSHLRCIEQAAMDLPAGLTLLVGPNGSGKTSVLEAMFLLGRGRSFRTRNNERLIQRGKTHLRVIGRTEAAQGGGVTIGFEVLGAGGATARVAGRNVESFAELSQVFPVQVIEPGVHKLVEEGASRRRRWMDWAVFHVEPPFVDTWLRYTRALRQRNAALKNQPDQAAAWDAEVAQLGEAIALSRGRFIEQLLPFWKDTVAALSGLPVQLHYHRGWHADMGLAEALTVSRARDTLRHVTHVGPHRADVSVRLEGRAAREVLSRGQQKLVAVAMTLAQLRLLQDVTQTTPTLLLDDPAAELDTAHLGRFIGQVRQLRSQLIVTSLTADSRLFGIPERTFHVDQGRVQPV